MKMCTTSTRLIFLALSIAVCTGIHHHQQQQHHDIYKESSELPINYNLDTKLEDGAQIEKDEDISELLDDNHPRDLKKLLEKYSDIDLEIDEIKIIEQNTFPIIEMANKEQTDKDLISDKSVNQESMAELKNSDDQGYLREFNDSNNDQETTPNLQVVLDSSVFVRGALRNIFEKILTNPETLVDTPVAELEKPYVRAGLRFSKTSQTLEAMAELQASDEVQNAIAELQASNVVRQAIVELQSSKAVQKAVMELQNSPVVRQVLTELQASNAVKRRLAEGLNSIQMIMTEASKSVQKAMAEDPKALQKAMIKLKASNEVQEAMASLKISDNAQEAMEQMKPSNDVQEAMENLMALNAVEEAIAEAQAAAGLQKTMSAEKAASHLQEFLAGTQAEAALQDDMAELQNLGCITVTMDKAEHGAAEFQDSSIFQESREDVHIVGTEMDTIDSVETSNMKVQATDIHEVLSRKPDAEGPNNSE